MKTSREDGPSKGFGFGFGFGNGGGFGSIKSNAMEESRLKNQGIIGIYSSKMEYDSMLMFSPDISKYTFLSYSVHYLPHLSFTRR